MSKKKGEVMLPDFNLTDVEIVQENISFKLGWKQTNWMKDGDVYETMHTVQDFDRNNKMVAEYMSELHGFIVAVNKHTNDVAVFPKKLKIYQYGPVEERQMSIKVDYEFTGSGEGMSKASTNKVLLDPEFWEVKEIDVNDVMITIGNLVNVMYQFIVNGQKYPIAEKELKMQGDTISV